jgi:hypothetical protein
MDEVVTSIYDDLLILFGLFLLSSTNWDCSFDPIKIEKLKFKLKIQDLFDSLVCDFDNFTPH